MAKRTLPAQSKLHVELFSWCLYVRGRREVLTQQGYAQSAPFPGDPGVKKTVCDSLDQQGRAIKIHRASKTTFYIYRPWTDDEKAWYDRREAQKQEAERIARMRDEEIQRATQLVNSWPKTEGAFRESSIESADLSFEVFQRVVLNGNKGGWRYDDATTHKIEHLIDQIFGLIETGGVVEDMVLKERNTPACIADVVLASQPKPGPRYKAEGNVIRLG